MVKIRLMRIGAKHTPHYRIVVVDARKKRGADYIEQIGFYDPRQTTEQHIKVDVERATHWLANGAQPTETVVRLLEQNGVEVPGVRAKRTDAYIKRSAASAGA